METSAAWKIKYRKSDIALTIRNAYIECRKRTRVHFFMFFLCRQVDIAGGWPSSVIRCCTKG